MIARLLLILFVMLTSVYATVSLTQEEQTYIKTHPVITLGADYRWPPFDFANQDGKPDGLSMDYLNLIAQKSGLSFNVQPAVWSETIEKMKNKKIDGLSCAVQTAEREKYLTFTTPYLSVPMVIITQTNTKGLKSLDELKGKVVSINKGSYIHEWLSEKYPDIKLHLSTSNENSLEMLSLGEVDAYVGNLAVATYIINKNLLNNVKISAKLDEFQTGVSIAIDKDKPILFSIIQKSINDISQQEAQIIKSKWSQNLESNKELLHFTPEQQHWIEAHKTIRYVIDNDFEPLEYLSHDGKKYLGIASSYLELMAQKTGITFVRVPTQVWSQSVETMNAKEADMYTCVTQTPSREKVVRFSKPYIIMPQVFVTKKDVGFITDIKELYGKKVALVEGYALSETIVKEHPQIKRLMVKNITDAFNAVVKGEAYAYMDLLPVASAYIQKKGLTNLKISGISLYQSKFKMALRNDWDEMGIEIINKVIDSISEEEKNTIYNQWIRVKYDKTIDYTIVLEIAAVFLLIIAASLFWNKKLSIEIEKRKKVELELIELNKKLLLANHEAQSATKAKSNFLSNMSHEIRTPMNSILGFAELLDEKIEDSKLKSFVKTIRSAGENLLVLINDILNLSKIESGKLEIINKATLIKKIFDEMMSIFTLQAEQKGLHLELSLDKKMPEVILIDAHRLKEILINLIGNALKFTDEGYIKIIVKVINTDKHHNTIDLVIKIKDSGIGIPHDAQDKIFSMFEQQDNQDARKYGGTGLGLAISKKLALLMNGSLDVQSDVGQGSTFTLTLNHLEIASLHDNDGNDDYLTNYNLVDFEEAVILVADDIEQNRRLIKESFSDTHISIIEAVNGQEAIEKVNSTSVDLILMDIRMPVLDGYSSAKIIKEHFDIPIIALTASIMKEDLIKIKEHRFDGYLKKPVSKNELYSELSKFLKHTLRLADTPTKIDIENSEDLKNFFNDLNLDSLYQTAVTQNDLEVITQFASALLALSTHHRIGYLQNYAQTLLEKIETFDIALIESMLHDYKKIMQTLREKIA